MQKIVHLSGNYRNTRDVMELERGFPYSSDLDLLLPRMPLLLLLMTLVLLASAIGAPSLLRDDSPWLATYPGNSWNAFSTVNVRNDSGRQPFAAYMFIDKSLHIQSIHPINDSHQMAKKKEF
jgi:hypothetical protein